MSSRLYRAVGDQLRILGARCSACGHQWFPRGKFGCERCGAHGDTLDEIEYGGRGRLLSFVLVPEAEGGFILARIALEEGPVVRGILEVADADTALGSLAPGDPVHAYLTSGGETESVRFRVTDG